MFTVELLAIVKNSDVALVLFLSLLGGTGSYMHGCKAEKVKPTIFNLITELVLAVTFGLAIMYLGQWKELPPPLVSILILLTTNNSSDAKPVIAGLFAGLIDKFFKTKKLGA